MCFSGTSTLGESNLFFRGDLVQKLTLMAFLNPLFFYNDVLFKSKVKKKIKILQFSGLVAQSSLNILSI